MTNYIGNRCPVCDKKFVNGDDIVVCPICGAPHHRECYALENHCSFEKDHISGKAWKPENFAEAPTGDFCSNPQDGEQWNSKYQDSKVCKFCGGQNPKDNIFCCFCGNRLSNQQDSKESFNMNPQLGMLKNMVKLDPTIAIYGGVSPTEDVGEFSAREVATFVGRSSAHYLPQFKKEAEDSKRISFNLPALFFGFIYFFYRKMYKIGALFLVATVLLAVPEVLYTIEAMPIIFKQSVGVESLEELGIDITEHIDNVDKQKLNQFSNINFYAKSANIFLHLIAGLLGNKLYYLHTMKKLKELKEKEETSGVSVGAIAHENTIKNSGGVNSTAIILIFVLIFVMSFLTSMYFLMSYMSASSVII